MGRKKTYNGKATTFTVGGEAIATRVGLGFSPYQQDKGSTYTPSVKAQHRKARKAARQDIRRESW